MDEQTKEKVYAALMTLNTNMGSKDIVKFDTDIEIRGGTFYKPEIEAILRISKKYKTLFYLSLLRGELTWVIH